MLSSLTRIDAAFREKTGRVLVNSNVGLISILVAATLLRFYGLDRQSLWLDELHTMNEASPNIPISEMFHYLTCCDQHPPLYFLLQKLLFSLFGYTTLVARSLSAVFGTLSVISMYFLGKELSGKRMGLIVALITTLNYYNIEYSQEARDYIMAFFFSSLSFLYFFRLVKTGGRKNIWFYGLSALGVMYSHYYGLFLVVGQYAAGLCLWLLSKTDRKTLFRNFSFSAIIFIVGFLPWLPIVKEMSKIKSFWASPIQFDYISKYFFDYFGDYSSVNPFLEIALIYYLICLVRSFIPAPGSIKFSPLVLSAITFFVTILVSMGIPVIRSIFVVPMLVERYTIVILPAVLIVIGFAFELIPFSTLRFVLLGIFVIVSFSRMTFASKFYSRVRKTQFRELTKYMVSDSTENSYPMVNERTAWQIQYYLDHYGYKGKVLVGQKEAIVDSILSKSSKTYDIAAFWIMGAHGGEKKLSDASQQALDTAYTLVKEKDFFDAWAQLYMNKKSTRSETTH